MRASLFLFITFLTLFEFNSRATVITPDELKKNIDDINKVCTGKHNKAPCSTFIESIKDHLTFIIQTAQKACDSIKTASKSSERRQVQQCLSTEQIRELNSLVNSFGTEPIPNPVQSSRLDKKKLFKLNHDLMSISAINPKDPVVIQGCTRNTQNSIPSPLNTLEGDLARTTEMCRPPSLEDEEAQKPQTTEEEKLEQIENANKTLAKFESDIFNEMTHKEGKFFDQLTESITILESIKEKLLHDINKEDKKETKETRAHWQQRLNDLEQSIEIIKTIRIGSAHINLILDKISGEPEDKDKPKAQKALDAISRYLYSAEGEKIRKSFAEYTNKYHDKLAGNEAVASGMATDIETYFTSPRNGTAIQGRSEFLQCLTNIASYSMHLNLKEEALTKGKTKWLTTLTRLDAITSADKSRISEEVAAREKFSKTNAQLANAEREQRDLSDLQKSLRDLLKHRGNADKSKFDSMFIKKLVGLGAGNAGPLYGDVGNESLSVKQRIAIRNKALGSGNKKEIKAPFEPHVIEKPTPLNPKIDTDPKIDTAIYDKITAEIPTDELAKIIAQAIAKNDNRKIFLTKKSREAAEARRIRANLEANKQIQDGVKKRNQTIEERNQAINELLSLISLREKTVEKEISDHQKAIRKWLNPSQKDK